MGDPVTIGVIASAGATAAQTYLGGRQARNQAKMQAAQLTTEQKAIEANAAIEQAERMNRLKETIASQNAVFAMGGQTAGAGTASAIQAASMSAANREQRLRNLRTDVAKSSYDFNIWSAKKTAKQAMTTSVITNVLPFVQRVGEAYVMNSFKPMPETGNDNKGGKK